MFAELQGELINVAELQDETTFPFHQVQLGLKLFCPGLLIITLWYFLLLLAVWSGYKWVEVKMMEVGVLNNSNYKITPLIDHLALITAQLQTHGVFDCKPFIIWNTDSFWMLWLCACELHWNCLHFKPLCFPEWCLCIVNWIVSR